MLLLFNLLALAVAAVGGAGGVLEPPAARWNGCASLRTCSRCLSDRFCGWCSAGGNGRGRCVEGDVHGPIAGLSSYCPQLDWLRASSRDDHAASWSGLSAPARFGGLVKAYRMQCASHALDVLRRQREAAAATAAEEVQLRQRIAASTCAPCRGAFPQCDCGPGAVSNVATPTSAWRIIRHGDEAVGVVEEEAITAPLAAVAAHAATTGPIGAPPPLSTRATAFRGDVRRK